MKFYFCEGCGVRVTEKDIEEQRAKNKQLKGVFCVNCAVGVTTMDSLPLSDAAAKELIANETQRNDVRKSTGKRPRSRTSSRMNVGAGPKRRTSSLDSSRITSTSARPKSKLLLVIGVGVGLAVIGGVALVATTGGKEQTRKNVSRKKKRSARPKLDVTEKATDNGVPAPTENVSEAPATTVVPPESKDSQPANPAPSTVADEKRVATAPPPVTKIDEKTQSTPAETAKTKEADQQKAVTPEPPEKPAAKGPDPAIEAKRLATRAFLERMFSALKDGDMANAVEICRAGKLPIARDARQVLERASKLQERALDELNRNPPTDTLNIKWKQQVISGQLARIKGGRAWIKSGPMELPVGLAYLPRDLLLRALKLDPKDPKGVADQAVFSFACGDVEATEAALARLEPDAVPGLRTIFAQIRESKRRDDFEATVAAVEAATKKGQRNRAVDLVEKLKQAFPEWCSGEQKARIDQLTVNARNTGLAKVLVQKVFKAEVLRVDEDYYVELRYDFVKNPQCVKDFTGKNLKTDQTGLAVSGHKGGGVFRADSLKLEAPFQPRKLRTEFRFMGVTSGREIRGQVVMIRKGNLFIKARGSGTGQFHAVYGQAYKGGWDGGMPLKGPAVGRSRECRYTFERTPENVVFTLDGQERARAAIAPLIEAAPRDLQTEATWNLGFAVHFNVTVIEMVVKGHLDRAWLMKRSQQPESAASQP